MGGACSFGLICAVGGRLLGSRRLGRNASALVLCAKAAVFFSFELVFYVVGGVRV